MSSKVARFLLVLVVCMLVAGLVLPAAAVDEVCIDSDHDPDAGFRILRVKIRPNPANPEACADPVGLQIPPFICKTLPRC
jgi:hypothetical protein